MSVASKKVSSILGCVAGRKVIKILVLGSVFMAAQILFVRPPLLVVASFSTSRILQQKLRPPGWVYQQTSRWIASQHDNVAAPSSLPISSCVRTIFDLILPEGRCIGVQLFDEENVAKNDMLTLSALSQDDHWIRKLLHRDEVDFAIQMRSESSRLTFLLGRLALRRSLDAYQQQEPTTDGSSEQFNTHNCVLLKDTNGRPTMPPGFLGSISHKGNVAVALVSSSVISTVDQSPLRAIGVDLERCNPTKSNVGKRILTQNEQLMLGKVANLDRDEEVMLRFSVKEALYKAMNPLICQYVGFREVEAQPNEDGTFDVFLNLNTGCHERFKLVQAHWKRYGDFFLTSAQIETKCETLQQL
ncbi:hypothetical protein ACA910_002843 [Epithemia clementina (nom. ined.)]